MAYATLKNIKELDELTQYMFVIEDEDSNIYTYYEIVDSNGNIEERIVVDEEGYEIYDNATRTWAEEVCR